jgi:hypothetical protein
MKTRIALALVSLLFVTSCAGMDKATEQYKDAPRGKADNSAADTINFPDGFSNVAVKCDGPNRVYVAFKGNDNRAAIAVVGNDDRCPWGEGVTTTTTGN